MKNLNQTNQKGFTLIELLVVLAIFGILGVVLAGEIASKGEEQNVSQFVADINEINAGMVKCGKIYSNDYTNCDIDELVRLGILDSDWGDGTGMTPWSGDYTSAVVAGNTARYTISGDGVSSDEYGNQLIEIYRNDSVAVPTYNTGTALFTVTMGAR